MGLAWEEAEAAALNTDYGVRVWSIGPMHQHGCGMNQGQGLQRRRSWVEQKYGGVMPMWSPSPQDNYTLALRTPN